MFDILIKNGTIIDGTGKPAKKADVAISKGKIADIQTSIPQSKAEKVIDAKDFFVAPGFIDIQNHSDSYWTIFDQPEQKSLLAQGITSIVIGNCGASLAPLASREALKTVQKWHNLSGVNVNWVSFAEFMQTLNTQKLGVNIASLVGHATLRRGLLGDSIRKVSAEEIKIMNQLLEQSLSEGSLGLSLGLIYAHEVDSTFEELIALAKTLKSQKKYLSVHLRSEEDQIVESIEEAITIGQKAEIPVKISHLKVRGKNNWHLFDRVINKLENAFHQGLDISFDVYPYSSTWAVLYTYLPKWAYEGGREQILRHISSPTGRRKILDYLKGKEFDFSKMAVATAQNNEVFVGKTISEIAKNQGVFGEEGLLNILSATNAEVMIFDHNLSLENVELFMTSPLSMLATDGGGYSDGTRNLVHPRCFGAMPKFLKMIREKKILSWEAAIKKITSEPARLMGSQNRGILAKGKIADVVIFDPKTVNDLADYVQPFRYPVGILKTIVNGTVALENNEVQSLTGKVILR